MLYYEPLRRAMKRGGLPPIESFQPKQQAAEGLLAPDALFGGNFLYIFKKGTDT